VLIKAFGKIKKKLCFYLLNLCVNHSVLSFFSFLCDNLLLQKCVKSLCEITVFLCVNLIDPETKWWYKKVTMTTGLFFFILMEHRLGTWVIKNGNNLFCVLDSIICVIGLQKSSTQYNLMQWNKSLVSKNLVRK